MRDRLNVPRTSQVLLLTLIFAAGVFHALLPYLELAYYSNLKADDYMLAHTREGTAFWAMQKELYDEWSGRYMANFYHALGYGISDPVHNYGFLIGAVLLAQFVGWSVFFGAFFGVEQAVALGMLALLVCLQMAPGPAEAFYWYCAGAVYQIPFANFLMLAGLVVRIFRQSGRLAVQKMLAGVMVFLSCGGNEILTVATVLFLAVGVVAGRALRRRQLTLLVLLGVAVLSAGLMFRAPGNEVRMEHNEVSHNLANACMNAFVPAKMILQEFFVQAWAWAVGLVAFLWGVICVGRQGGRLLLPGAAILGLAMPGICLMSSIMLLYGMGNAAFSDRVVVMILQFLLVLWVCFCALAGMACSGLLGRCGGFSPKIRLEYTLACGAFLILIGHVHFRYRIAQQDLAEAPQWRNSHLHWDARLKRVETEDPVVAYSGVHPLYLDFGDPFRKPQSLVNGWFADYYHKNSIKVK